MFDTTSARETWTDDFGPAYDDSGTALIGPGRWVLAGNDFDHVKELAKGLSAPLAST
ncbi:hypothetical protein GCM10025870_01310 [Agromyces marinus]|uniref:Uncharacterized protein n=1 Tax=Agromyces marinus TaxID=1389020 RepID=A0ABM8GX58_9MICO|nr:hypothetical protein GCM10025870_01310 [Agromyces marinus]